MENNLLYCLILMKAIVGSFHHHSYHVAENKMVSQYCGLICKIFENLYTLQSLCNAISRIHGMKAYIYYYYYQNASI